MPPRPSPAMTIPGYHDHNETQFKKWADLIKDDPRRVCRAMLLYSPRGETVEGDTFDDIPFLFIELKKSSAQSTSKEWKGLVDAGVVSALCKYAINAEASLAMAYATVDDDGVGNIIPQSLEMAKANAPAPYTPALEVLCNAAMSCSNPATSTEHKMIEELKKNWSPIMQRLWSLPSRTLDKGGNDPEMRVRERVVVAQIIHRLAFIDPTFLEVMIKPSDLTLAVCFRYWLYSTSDYDSASNCSLLLPLVYDLKPDNWKRYFAEHPLPDMHALLPRILLGASRGTEKKKRTPNQTAEFIVTAFGDHFRRLKARDLDHSLMFFTGMLTTTKKEFPPFCRAVYRSEHFWASTAEIITRYPHVDPRYPKKGFIPEGFPMVVATLYLNVLHTPEGEEYADELLFNWLTGGLLDALDAAHLTMIRSPRGAMTIAGILIALDTHLSKLSTKTRSKLRAELPRQRLMSTFVMLATKGSRNPDDLLAVVGDITIHSSVPLQDPRHPIWAITAWQTLLRLTYTLRPLRGTCTRRGCEKPAWKIACTRCKLSAYCSQDCVKRDDEHKFICHWVPTLMFVDLYQRRDKGELTSLRDGVAPERPADLPTLEEQLERMRASGEMSEEMVKEFKKFLREDEAPAATADDPSSGMVQVQKAMEDLEFETRFAL